MTTAAKRKHAPVRLFSIQRNHHRSANSQSLVQQRWQPENLEELTCRWNSDPTSPNKAITLSMLIYCRDVTTLLLALNLPWSQSVCSAEYVSQNLNSWTSPPTRKASTSSSRRSTRTAASKFRFSKVYIRRASRVSGKVSRCFRAQHLL